MGFLAGSGIIFIVLAVIGLIIFAILWAKHLEKKRTEAMGHVSELMHFKFSAVVPPDGMAAAARFGLFNVGHSRSARNFMAGQIGEIPVMLMDYSYTTGGGKHQHRHNQTVILLAAPGLPEFTLAPENWTHKIGQWFGMQDIDFDEHAAFSKNCLLRGQDVNAIRRTFTLEALDFFSAHYQWHIESKSGFIATWKNWCPPDACPEYVAEAVLIHGLLASPPSAEASS
jgi:hypothetical protein